jgi:hypothetical protein
MQIERRRLLAPKIRLFASSFYANDCAPNYPPNCASFRQRVCNWQWFGSSLNIRRPAQFDARRVHHSTQVVGGLGSRWL